MKLKYNKLITIGFFALYLLLIISSADAIKSNDGLAREFFIARVALVIGILLTYALKCLFARSMDRRVLVYGVVFIPYLFTSGFLLYVDTLLLLIFATTLERHMDAKRFFVSLAAVSLAIVAGIALLAELDIVSTKTFQWAGTVKESLGFTNPNTLFYYIFSATAVFYYFGLTKAFWVAIGLGAALFPVVGSRAYFGAQVLLGILWLLPFNRIRTLRQTVALAWIGAVLLAGVALVFLPKELSAQISALAGTDVNELSSKRVQIAVDANERTGAADYILGGMENEADSLYSYFITEGGLLEFAAVVVFVGNRLRRKGAHGKERALLCVFLTVGLVELPYSCEALLGMLLVWIVCDSSVPIVVRRRPSKVYGVVQ